MNNYIEMIAFVMPILAILILLFTHNHYSKVKKNLNENEKQSMARIELREKESKEAIEQNELDSQNRIKSNEQAFLKMKSETEAILSRKENELNKRIEIFNREQAIRENYASKSDREISIDLHVKLNRMMEKLDSFEISAIRNNTEQVIGAINGVNEELSSITEQVDTLDNNLDYVSNHLGDLIADMKESINENIADYSNSLTQTDVEDAMRNAMNSYNSYMLESSISEVIKNGLDSMSDEIVSQTMDSIEGAVDRAIQNVASRE